MGRKATIAEAKVDCVRHFWVTYHDDVFDDQIMSKHCEGKWIWEREGAGWTLMTSTAYVDLGLKPHPVISMSRSQEGKRKEREIWHEAYVRFMALGLCHALATSYGGV